MAILGNDVSYHSSVYGVSFTGSLLIMLATTYDLYMPFIRYKMQQYYVTGFLFILECIA